MVKLLRINKLLARYGSRREVDKLVHSGWVRINGKVAQAGEKYEVPDDYLDNSTSTTADAASPIFHIELDKYAEKQISFKTSVILNKPLGYVSNQPDERSYAPAVKLLTMANQYTKFHAARVEPRLLGKMAVAGRLDINSTGLLLFTQCGRTASQIIGPTSNVEKEYLVRFDQSTKLNYMNSTKSDRAKLKKIRSNDLLHDSGEMQEILHTLRSGITCGGERLTAKAIDIINRDQLRFTLERGKKHHIRRMLTAVKLNVRALKRVRIGNISLGKLPTGYWRVESNAAMSSLYRMTIAYDGTRFQGIQRQVDNSTMMKDHEESVTKRPKFEEKTGKRRKHDVLTVQDVLERALLNLYRDDGVNVVEMCLKMAGRTDKGVHATGQVIAVKLPHWNHRHQQHQQKRESNESNCCNDEGWNMRKSINSRLPMDISVQDVKNLGDDSTFDPRRNVKQKQYTYRIKFRRKLSSSAFNIGGMHSIRHALDPSHVWVCPWSLDDSKLESLCTMLCGKHDYANFVHRDARDICDHTLTIDKVAFECLRVDTDMIDIGSSGAPIFVASEVVTGEFIYQGRGFRRTMLRNFTGYMVDVCRGIDNAPSSAEIYDTSTKSDVAARVNAAPSIGLCLKWIRYDDEE